MKVFHHLPEHKNLFVNPVVTIGNFDGVHLGHRKILAALTARSAEVGGEPVVITFSTHPRKILNPEMSIRILTTTEEKVNAIYHCGVTNIIILNFTLHMAQMPAIDFYHEILIGRLDARYLVIGYDHTFGKNREGNFSFLSELSSSSGLEAIRIEPEDRFGRPVSSTWIRSEIEQGNIRTANSLLGWRYLLTGRVVRGSGRGRLLGFPTANIEPLNRDKIIPGDGVYAIRARLEDGSVYRGMLNIGTNPTFGNGSLSIEAHLFDFNDNIYDEIITIEFYDRIRDEKRFSSGLELAAQIQSDRETALNLLAGPDE